MKTTPPTLVQPEDHMLTRLNIETGAASGTTRSPFDVGASMMKQNMDKAR